jgi:hypothetical protein
VPPYFEILVRIPAYLPSACYRDSYYSFSLQGDAVAFHKIVERFYHPIQVP